MSRSTPWLQFWPPAGDPRLRLFCFPHAGGGTAAYRSWTAELPPFMQLCPILLPGRETRLSEVPYTQIDPLVDAIDQELRPWLEIPFAVFGHSMGALLAFEWVRKLRTQKASAPVWLFLSGRRAPDSTGDPSLLHLLPDTEFVRELIRLYDGIPAELLDHEELLDVFLPILRADISVVESYRFQEDEPLECPLTVFSGVNDASVSWDQLLAWKRHVSPSRFAVKVFPGGHFYPQRPLLRSIYATLTELNVKRE